MVQLYNCDPHQSFCIEVKRSLYTNTHKHTQINRKKTCTKYETNAIIRCQVNMQCCWVLLSLISISLGVSAFFRRLFAVVHVIDSGHIRYGVECVCPLLKLYGHLFCLSVEIIYLVRMLETDHMIPLKSFSEKFPLVKHLHTVSPH